MEHLKSYLSEKFNERVVDIAFIDGEIWAADSGEVADLIEEGVYLFSVAFCFNLKNLGECRIFDKDYKKADIKPKGKYFITIKEDVERELHCTQDYDKHVFHNINNTYLGPLIKQNYIWTLTLDMDAMTASLTDDEDKINERVFELQCNEISEREHQNSFRQPY